MDILLLGGPKFVGRAVIDAALDGGHNVTLFNRGQTNAELYPHLERLVGDRDGGLAALDGRIWDAIIDISGYFPRVVRASAERLAASTGRYLFISSISVYASIEDATEASPLAILPDPAVEQITGATYGGLKALCELAVEDVFGERAINVRPGLIVGPHDPTDRFTYWVHRTARGGPVLAPEGPDVAVQVIDVRDLAQWLVRLLQSGASGAFNATGPDYRLTFGEMLQTGASEAGTKPDIVWKSPEFLAANNVAPWSMLPLYQPAERWASVNIDRALSAGLTFRPLAETVRDTLAWIAEVPRSEPLLAGLSQEREAELLAREAEA